MTWSFKSGRPVTIQDGGSIYVLRALDAPSAEGCRVRWLGRGQETFLYTIEGRGGYGAAIPEIFSRTRPDQEVPLALKSGDLLRARVLGFDARGNPHVLEAGALRPVYLLRSKLDLGATIQNLRTAAIQQLGDGPEILITGGQEARVDGQSPSGAFSLSVDLGKGSKYAHNEDSGFVYKAGASTYFGIFDGAGGEGDGRAASQRVAISTLQNVKSGDPLHNGTFEPAARDLYRALEQQQIRSTASAAAAVAQIDGNTFRVVYSGDVRFVVIRAGKVELATQDETPVARDVAQGKLRPEQALTDPRRNAIDSAVQAGRSHFAQLYMHKLAPGDWVIGASDGLWGHLTNDDLAGLLSRAETPSQAQGILQNVFMNGLPDRPNPDDNLALLVYRHSAPKP